MAAQGTARVTRTFLKTYALDDFAGRKAKECDLVMKGGVTSGVVYPYALLELAQTYRFRCIGGTSAGGIAAAFAAAAEYSRTLRGDPGGFLRMQARCETLPDILGSLFQPSPRFAGLMRFLLKAQKASGPVAMAGHALATFWGVVAIGALLGGGLMTLARGGWAGAVLGAVVGAVAGLLIRGARLIFVDMPKHGFGLCPGIRQRGHDGPALTDWLHDSIQDIAFGPEGRDTPLTFGDLAGPDAEAPIIDLKMVTTNLSMSRPHTLPRLKLVASYEREAWAELFPAMVMSHLDAVVRRTRHKGQRGVPKPEDLPVVIAVRMSLSFPFLFQAVPMFIRDQETARINASLGVKTPIHAAKAWFSDGGISSNFPIHLFDALLPLRPTFALSIDDLPREALAWETGGGKKGERVHFTQKAGDGVGVPVKPITSMGGFAMSLLSAAKDWQDQLLAGMAGQRERIARVYLSPKEGGLNLTMTGDTSRALMDYGRQVGAGFAEGRMDFDEHRWRRTLVLYNQLQQMIPVVERTWTSGAFGAWLKGHAPKSYMKVSQADREAVRKSLDAFAALGGRFQPVIDPEKFPKPPGRLRITPDV
ncbi:MAG: patatin [Caulobacter sp.]|nr:patatin [Caulobacter sp.]